MYQTYVATFIAAALYAVFLQLLGKAYEPRWTWLTVVVGVGLVMLGAAARITLLPRSWLMRAAICSGTRTWPASSWPTWGPPSRKSCAS
jgi:hypothetical protein